MSSPKPTSRLLLFSRTTDPQQLKLTIKRVVATRRCLRTTSSRMDHMDMTLKMSRPNKLRMLMVSNLSSSLMQITNID